MTSYNLIKGKEKERKVLNFLISKKYDANLYLCHSKQGEEESQIIYLENGMSFICPDIEIFSDRKRNIYLMRVEVKSYDKPYKNYKYLDEKISSEIDFVTIHKYQFDDYLNLQSQEEVECRVVFVIGEKMYWKSLDELYKIPKIKAKAYGETDGFHYVWRLQDMNNDFSDF